MALQESNSLSESLDASLSADDRIADNDNQSSSTASSTSDPSLSRNVSFSRLNAQAPEFIPRSSSSSPTTSQPGLVIPHQPPPPPPGLFNVYPAPNSPFHVPVQSHMAVPVQNHHTHLHHIPVQYHHNQHQYHHHHRTHHGGFGVGGHHEVPNQAQQRAPVDPPDHVSTSRNELSQEATEKILNQVEYYFSDVNLVTTDHLMRFINKDPEGYVPISVVASFKKIKALISSNSQLATILRNSAKLVVSEDGKKVRRQHPLTESDMEELQSRIVIAENLPEDHCHQNLLKIFSSVGSVKTIRTCQPQPSNSGASSASRSAKTDSMLYSNKLHAFVEYESVELAEKAVAELNDGDNWRSGLRVRLFFRCTAKSAPVRGKIVVHEGEVNHEEDDTSTLEQQQPSERNLEDPSQQSDAQSHEHVGEDRINDREGGQRKGRSRGRGKGRGRSQYNHNNRGGHIGTPPADNTVKAEQLAIAKQPPGPRMPDGTRGFSMGRGKPVAVNIG